MYNKDSQIVETVSGKWLRFPNHFKTSCLVELPNQIALSIDIRSGSVHVHKKDNNQVYQHIGDVSISASRNHIQTSVKNVPKYEHSDSVFNGHYSANHHTDQTKSLEKEESA